MGISLSRAEVVKGLEPLNVFAVNDIRLMFARFQNLCPTPALWERAFYELLGCFDSAETCSKAFLVIDTDGNGLVDAREVLGALAVLSKGRLTDRMALLFDIFDLNSEKEMAFDEVFLMLRRTMAGLRKMVGISVPPEKIIHSMTKQIYKTARKHRDHRILVDDWYNWWVSDASCRNALKMFCWNADDQRGLPTPDQYSFVDYAKGVQEGVGPDDPLRALRGGADPAARPPTGKKDSGPQPELDRGMSAHVNSDGSMSRPKFDIQESEGGQQNPMGSPSGAPRPPEAPRTGRSASPRPRSKESTTVR